VVARPLIRRMSDRHAGERRHWTPPVTVLAGFMLGVLVTMSSVGRRGALGMTLLVILYPRDRLVRLVGSDVAHAVPLTLVARIGHLLLGAVDWRGCWSRCWSVRCQGSCSAATSARACRNASCGRAVAAMAAIASAVILATILIIVGIRMLTR